MENLPKTRGRPRKIPKPKADALGVDTPEKTAALSAMFGLAAPTERTHANSYYADGGRQLVEHYIKQGVEIPHDPLRAARIRAGWDWILTKKTVLTELGRMMVKDPTEQDMRRVQGVVDYVADKHERLGARGAVAHVRRMRLGETKQRKERVAALHHELNDAINLHRQRFPESSWEDIRQAVDLTLRQVAKKAR